MNNSQLFREKIFNVIILIEFVMDCTKSAYFKIVNVNFYGGETYSELRLEQYIWLRREERHDHRQEEHVVIWYVERLFGNKREILNFDSRSSEQIRTHYPAADRGLRICFGFQLPTNVEPDSLHHRHSMC